MDNLTLIQRKKCMSNIKSKHTTPEKKVRKILTELGFRYRLHIDKLPGKPDIVMSKYKTAIFINGCFWHQHKGCKKCTTPKSNVDYWDKKLKRNVERQKQNVVALKELGWRVVIIWECQAKDNDFLLNKFEKIFLIEY